MIKKAFDLYIRLVTEFPKLVLSAVFIVTIGLAAGLPNFKLDASSDSLTLEHDTDLDYFREVAKQYQSGDFLIVTFRPNETLFSDQSLALLSDLQRDLGGIEGVVGIDSILNVPLLYSPKQSLSDIMQDSRTLMTPGTDRQLAQQEFLTSPIYKELILGPDQQTTALQLSIAVDEKYIVLVQHRDELRLKKRTQGLSSDEQEELNRAAKEFLDYRTAAESRAHARVEDVRRVVATYKDRAEIFVGGITMITADMITFIENDLVVFGAAVVLFMIIILAFIFRSLRFVVIPMLCCLSAVVMMLGLVSWLDWRLTVISSNFVALLLIISLAIIIHLLVRYREYAAEFPDWNQKQLVTATVKFMARPCLYTSLTTVVAFVSFVVSDIRPVIDFGWLMTMGLLLALGLAFLIMPACFVLLPREKIRSSETENKSKPAAKPFSMFFSDIVDRYGRAVILGSLFVAVLSVVGISRLQVENKFIDYFHESTEIYQGLSVIDKNLGGTTSLDIIINAASQELLPSSLESFDGEDDPFADEYAQTPDSYA
ncbi:MAG: putative RND superfamily exporter protein, partial [Lentisphaeria bacterium]